MRIIQRNGRAFLKLKTTRRTTAITATKLKQLSHRRRACQFNTLDRDPFREKIISVLVFLIFLIFIH